MHAAYSNLPSYLMEYITVADFLKFSIEYYNKKEKRMEFADEMKNLLWTKKIRNFIFYC